MPPDFMPTTDDGDLVRLASAWCDEAITDAELAKLQATLAADPQARLQFISYMGVHGGIKTEIVGNEHIESFIPLPGLGAPAAPPTTGAPTQHFLQFRRWLGFNPARVAWAAALLIAVLGAGAAWYVLHTRAADFRSSPDHQAVAHDQSVPGPFQLDPRDALARVAEQSADCQWYFDRSGKVPTDRIRSGETVRVTNGMMKLLFDNGTLVTLHAPAIFEVISDMRARVLLGKVTAKIGPNAKGFSIITPQATVIDLGTEFGIEVNEVGATDVVVFRGAVDVDYPTTLVGAARQQRLQTGEAVHLDAKGTASRIVAITNGQFADKPSASDKPPIITEVRDNIERESAWNFYEIVHGGMAEDAKAFVDREAHEWNGVTAAGMPSYLLGGDYVKTFNNDKVRKDIEITVTLARPCRLFILFDDRIPAPDWLVEGFRNTGDKIGVDEGPYMVGNGKWKTEHQPGVGPGVSVDNKDSIWECDILEPGTICLGGTETPVSAINMYGIVAVPLEKDEAHETRPQPEFPAPAQ
jgi:hypothetical protein